MATGTMRVEITEERLSDADPATGRHYVHEEGDVIRVPSTVGERWCGLGWAKDVDGRVESGERKPGVQALVVEPVKVAGKSKAR